MDLETLENRAASIGADELPRRMREDCQEDQGFVPYFVFQETPCPYLPGRFERKLLTELVGSFARPRYDILTQSGFRRSHRFAYRPACQGCQACIPVRVRAPDFEPSQSQRRVLRANDDLSSIIRGPQATQEHFGLFHSYIRSRHGEGEMAGMGPDDYAAMVEDTGLDSAVVEFRRPDNALIAVLLMDWLGDGASAVYSFFSPGENRRSLGTYMILWLIEAVRGRELSHVYLGYLVADCQKMSYKSRFRPIERLGTQGWEEM